METANGASVAAKLAALGKIRGSAMPELANMAKMIDAVDAFMIPRL